MSGGAIALGGQQLSGLQSTGDGQPALNENISDESCGSRPAGGSMPPAFATSANVYGEKSPVLSSVTTSVSGSSSVAAATPTTVSASPPLTTMFGGARLSPRASFRNV